MFVVDTNVLVYAADRDSPFHAPCNKSLREWRRQRSAWYLTWGIIYEFLRVSTHPRVFSTPWTAIESWNFVQALLASPALGVLIPTHRHAEVVSVVFRSATGWAGWAATLQFALGVRERKKNDQVGVLARFCKIFVETLVDSPLAPERPAPRKSRQFRSFFATAQF